MSRSELKSDSNESGGLVFYYRDNKLDKRMMEVTRMREARVINRARIHASVRGRPLSAVDLQTMSRRHAGAFHAAFITMDEGYAERMTMLAIKAAKARLPKRGRK